MPTGGTITYAYSGGSNGITCADGSAATLTRTTPDGTWTYAQVKGTGAAYTTTVTDPQGNATLLQFQGIYETQGKVYQGSTSGTLIATTNTCYNGSTSPCNDTAITLPITQRAVITTLPVPGSTTLQSKSVAFYNSVGMPTETDVYAFGSSPMPRWVASPRSNKRFRSKMAATFSSLKQITTMTKRSPSLLRQELRSLSASPAPGAT
jgi:hypothetical protein